jgi:hypothetical protein
MIKTLLTTAALALTVASAHAATMPKFLEGQWCQHEDGLFIRAKNFCKPTRPTVFTISKSGLGISGWTVCAPVSVDRFPRGWTVIADCGDSHPLEFQFEDGETYGGPKGSLAITQRRAEIF